MAVKVTIDDRDIKDGIRRLQTIGPKAMGAVRRSLNRSIRGVKTDTAREIRREYNVRAKDVKESFHVNPARGDELRAVATSRGSRIPLIAFSPRPSAPPTWRGVPIAKRRPAEGVSVRIKKTREVRPGTFTARMRGGHTGVFFREGKDRLPIYEDHGPSIPQMIEHDADALDRIRAGAVDRFNKTLDHEIDRVLQGLAVK